MYPISNTLKNKYIAGEAENIQLTIYPVVGDTLIVTEENLRSFTLDRSCCSGTQLEIGSTIASEIEFTLENSNGIYDDFVFEGAEVLAKSKLRSETNYIPLGYFTIDNSPRKLSSIKIRALDRMVLFDKKITSDIVLPATADIIIDTICDRCNVTLGTIGIVDSYQISGTPDYSKLTYRQMLQYVCQMIGGNAYIDYDGYLRVEKYRVTNPVLTLGHNVRFSSDVYEDGIAFSGVTCNLNSTTLIAGVEGYMLDVSNNELVNNQNDVDHIYSAIQSISYYPYECTTKSFPFLYPMDCVSVVDNKGNTVLTTITNFTYTFNKQNKIQAVGETAEAKGFATLNPLTAYESRIIEGISTSTATTVVDSKTAFIINQNKLISNSLGLYVIEQSTGSGTIYYYCDQPTLADSNIIYTFGSNGFAWTTDWNDGSPVWQYSITRDGNAILNILTVNKLTTDQLNITGAIKFTDLNAATQNTISTASSDASNAVLTANAASADVSAIESNIYYTGTTYIDGAKIQTGTVTANQINAANLQVAAANITGTLTANQIDATNLHVSSANIDGTITASALDAATGSFTYLETNKVNNRSGYIDGWEYGTVGDAEYGVALRLTTKSGNAVGNSSVIIERNYLSIDAPSIEITGTATIAGTAGSDAVTIGDSSVLISGSENVHIYNADIHNSTISTSDGQFGQLDVSQANIDTLVTGNYGSSLPASGEEGEIFFLLSS